MPVGYPRGRVNAKLRIYMAGPLGFSKAGRHFYNSVLVPYVRSLGYEVLDPWGLTDARKIEAVQRMPLGPGKSEGGGEVHRRRGAAHPEGDRRGPRGSAVPDGH